MMYSIDQIRNFFIKQLEEQNFVIDKTGCKMIELPGACFIADQPSIFGTVNEDYVKREIEWYDSMSLNVNDIPPPVPKIWQQVATEEGLINSNYGWCIYSEENFKQYDYCLETLKKDPYSRRAIMIYTRPQMQEEYNRDGMSDFMCTNDVQYLIREGALQAIVQMRSNDVVFGYKNDYAWQRTVQTRLAKDLDVPVGDILWQVGSLHVYERHFDMVKNAQVPATL